MVYIILRCIILYFTVTAAVRIMGKRQIGELQPCELVITILISELASIPIQDLNMPILYGILPILTLAALEIGVSFLTLKSIKFRRLFYGTPITIVRDGKIEQAEMERARVSVDDLAEAMRTEGIADIRDIGYAVLETNGNMSIIDKQQGQMPDIVLSDGEFDNKAIKRLGIKKRDIITKSKVKTKDDLFLVLYDKNGNYYIVKKTTK